ncbi:MAG: hypothetical protein K5829_03200 [Treponema sp.]|nr:hypothetical protein [Treponema sp.]
MEKSFENDNTDELLPLSENHSFMMTDFAANSGPLLTLESEVQAPKETIIQEDGVFKIADNLSYTDLLLDPAFKKLVDSVLR